MNNERFINDVIIRKETPSDYNEVEIIIREAFYNMYVPGCMEHYLAHIMREHDDFITELDLVAEYKSQIIGNIMYTKAKLTDEAGCIKEVLTFGPLSVRPGFQRMGIGKLLIKTSFEIAAKLGFDTVVIFGSPANYVSSGFKSCKKYNIMLENGRYPAAMMVKELVQGALNGHKWIYSESPAMCIDEKEAERFDSKLPKMEKCFRPSQEEFYIMSNSYLE